MATWQLDLEEDTYQVRNGSIENPTKITAAKCLHCGHYTVWINQQMSYPTGTGIPAAEQMPESAKSVFEEAQSIAHLSPRASVALLRVCLERLVTAAGGKGGNLASRIASLGLSPRMQKLCDACRLGGNEAVHREGIDFSINNQEALALVETLSKFINRLTDEFFALEKEADEALTKFRDASQNAS